MRLVLAGAALVFLVAAGGAAAASGVRIYAIGDTTAPQISSADIIRASIRAASDAGQPVVAFSFTRAGAKKFHLLTLALARRGARLHRFARFAFEVDGKVYSRPYVDYRAFPQGFSGSAGVEVDVSSLATARKLAGLMRAY